MKAKLLSLIGLVMLLVLSIAVSADHIESSLKNGEIGKYVNRQSVYADDIKEIFSQPIYSVAASPLIRSQGG